MEGIAKALQTLHQKNAEAESKLSHAVSELRAHGASQDQILAGVRVLLGLPAQLVTEEKN